MLKMYLDGTLFTLKHGMEILVISGVSVENNCSLVAQQQQTSSGKNAWCLLCMAKPTVTEIIFMLFSYPFLCIISSNTDSYCIKCVRYSLIVLHH